jgi:heat shock protein HslJ/membrane-bound inhibitor of C-type lysozyme
MSRFSSALLCLFALSALSACDESPDDASQTQLTLAGQADMAQPATLATGSELRLSVINLSALADSDGIIAEKTTTLERQQPPLDYDIKVFRDQLKPGNSYALSIQLDTPDQHQWTTNQLQLIQPQQEAESEKTLLSPITVATDSNTSLYVCGDKTIQARLAGQSMQLHINDKVFSLKHAVSASGARFQSADETIVFWTKGQEAMLTTAGNQWPTCNQVSDDSLATLPFHAQGNEPGWALTADFDAVSLVWNYGKQHLVMRHPQLKMTRSGFIMHTRQDQRPLNVNVIHSLCRDSMSGRPYPQYVTVRFGSENLSGCGGNSLDLLTGREWVVEDIDKHGIIDASHITLQFSADGQLSGLAGCNRYSTAFELKEQIDINEPIATRKACAPALMRQEQLFLALLAEVDHIDFDDKGALLLSTAEGSTITARR